MEYLFINNGAELLGCTCHGGSSFTCNCFGEHCPSDCGKFEICGVRAPICGVDIPECPLKISDL